MGDATCSEPGCRKKIYSRGLCENDYAKLRRLGALPAWQPKLPFGMHCLSNVDAEAKTADCLICGPGTTVRVRKRQTHLEFECRTRRRERTKLYNARRREAEGKTKRKALWPTPSMSARDYYLRSTHKITLIEYDAMREAQGGACAICYQVVDGILVVDHCHQTGVIRGLLCNACNVGIGFLRDNPASLIRAATYVQIGLAS